MQAGVITTKILGEVTLLFENQSLVRIELGKLNVLITELAEKKLLDKVKQELDAYFQNPQHDWQLDYSLQVSPFQEAVLTEIRQIPVGKALTYGNLAKRLKTAARAIGGACRRNPLPIIFPCHRIVAENGLGGYSGARAGKWLTIKQQLLQHEGYC